MHTLVHDFDHVPGHTTAVGRLLEISGRALHFGYVQRVAQPRHPYDPDGGPRPEAPTTIERSSRGGFQANSGKRKAPRLDEIRRRHISIYVFQIMYYLL